MDFAAIAREVETSDFSSSSVHRYIGGNVKSPGLVRGNHYIIKFWSVKSNPGSDNPYWVGQFVGAGESPDKLLAETPRARDMSETQRYFFKRPTGEFIGAANFGGALVVNNDSEQRITFYALLTDARQDALPFDAPSMRPDKTSAVKLAPAPREPRQTPVSAKPMRERQQRIDDDAPIAPDRLKALFAPPAKVEYTEYYAAYFRTENEARHFAAQFTDGSYEPDAFAYVVLAPHDGNQDSDFFNKAASAGAFNRVNYRKPAKKLATR